MAAQDAELKLKVSLDLAYFRRQLATLSQQLGGQSIQLNATINRESVQKELNRLSQNLKRRQYRLEIATNLDAEIRKAKKLANELTKVSTGGGGTIPLKTKTFRQELTSLDTAQIAKIYRAAGKESLLAFQEGITSQKGAMITALNQAANNASQGFLDAFENGSSKVRKAAGEYGEALLGGLKKTLRMASPSREMWDIGDDAGKGFELGLLQALDIAENSATRRMKKMLDRLARMVLIATGMSTADIQSQAAGVRAGGGVPAPSWASSAPNRPGYQGKDGRLLPPGPTFPMLGGSSFGSQKYLPTDLSAELKKILRGAAFAFVDAIKRDVRAAKISIGASGQRALPSTRIAGLLPPGIGLDPREARIRQAYARSEARGASVMMEKPPGAFLPPAVGRTPAIYGGPQKGMAGFGGAAPIDLSIFQQSRVPLSGAIRELGQEFGNAVKQVLLFGTAYKALAFFTSLPGEAFEAAKALATYKNQLDAVTSGSGTFERSFAFVDNLAERFNVPLESARQGFVKLYASMEPSGFAPGQIENLFEGISKATAAFGLSADKVDRVNYAFAQMASKGQIMSEELKGQLGDVLPGALALFAEAAQMTIPEFSQAMEDGAFKGDAMRQVLDNVAVLMNTKFGPAAANASKTLQGALNQMQNNLKLMYESMSPIVDRIAAVFGPKVNSLINDVTSAVEALTGSFTSNTDIVGTLSPRAEALYFAFQQIGPSFAAAAQNAGNFTASLQVLSGPLLSVTKVLLDFASIPFVARIGTYAAILATLNAAFLLLAKTGIVQATVAMIRFMATFNVAQINVYIAGIRTVIAVLGSMATAANIARVAVIGLKVALGGVVVAAVLTGLDALAQKVLNIGSAADSSKQSVREFAQELDRIAGSADIDAATKAYLDANTELAKARRENQKALNELALARLRPVDQGGDIASLTIAEQKTQATYGKVIAATTKVRQARQTRDTAIRLQEEERARTQQQLKPIDFSAAEGDSKAGKLGKYIADTTRALQIEKERMLVAVEDRLLRKQISESDAKQQSLLIEKQYEEKAVNEALRVATQKANEENLSAGDKALKITDLQKESVAELQRIQEKYGVDVLKVQLSLQKPLEDAISEVNDEITKQAMLNSNLDNGLTELTADQKAYLDVQALTRDYTDAEKESVQNLIDSYQALREEYYNNEKAVQRRIELQDKLGEVQSIGGGLSAGFTGSAASVFEQAMQGPNADIGHATKLAEMETQAMKLRSIFEGIQGAISGVGSAFGSLMTEGIAGMISGTVTAKEVFTDFLKSVGQALQQAAAQMIATYIAIGIARLFAGFSGGGGKGLESYTPEGNAAFMQRTAALGYANGGIAPGGFKAFANGGVVNGPTLGLVGEGKYNEAIVPLPDGKSIPVQMKGESIGDKMKSSQSAGGPPMLNMSFQTTKFGDTEYVSKDQLEQAMMVTQSIAAKKGAMTGASMAIDKLVQNPSIRKKVGLG